ncbi:MAG: PocR ligand-binding domain-containing protein [Eubacterium sp.]|nr:PocR ligand-binding domain-containing protein [Eubacterium sp.]
MEQEIRLSDIIEVGTLQEWLDSFAKSVGMTVYAVDAGGAVTKTSNPNDFCRSVMRGTSQGRERCSECDLHGAELARRTGKPAIYTCHSGLVEFAVPIMIDDKHIGTFIGGQVLTEQPDISAARSAAEEIGVDPDEYVARLQNVRTVSREYVDNAAQLLFRFAQIIGEYGGRKLTAAQDDERRADGYAEIKEDFRQVSEHGAQMIENVKELSSEFDRIRKKAEVADKTVAMTDSILNYIQNVATQMTLLGFNASIEAKHAGDAGAGFNVIAQEVRQLAEQTSSRIRSVEEVLNNVKMSIKNIERELASASEKVKENIDTVNELNAAINSAAEKIKEQ